MNLCKILANLLSLQIDQKLVSNLYPVAMLRPPIGIIVYWEGVEVWAISGPTKVGLWQERVNGI